MDCRRDDDEYVRLVNCTPHDVRVVTRSGLEFVFPKTGQVARTAEYNTEAAMRIISPEGAHHFVETTYKTFGEVEDLPAPQSGVVYIVSLIVLNATQRNDVVCPDTGPDSVIRDAEGRITGVRRLMRK